MTISHNIHKATTGIYAMYRPQSCNTKGSTHLPLTAKSTSLDGSSCWLRHCHVTSSCDMIFMIHSSESEKAKEEDGIKAAADGHNPWSVKEQDGPAGSDLPRKDGRLSFRWISGLGQGLGLNARGFFRSLYVVGSTPPVRQLVCSLSRNINIKRFLPICG